MKKQGVVDGCDHEKLTREARNGDEGEGVWSQGMYFENVGAGAGAGSGWSQEGNLTREEEDALNHHTSTGSGWAAWHYSGGPRGPHLTL